MSGDDTDDFEITAADLDIGWERLSIDVRVFRGKGKGEAAYADLIRRALEGDTGLARELSTAILGKFLTDATLNAVERFFVAWLLNKLYVDEGSARGFSGQTTGRTRDGSKGLNVALDIVEATHHAARMEDAWALVADANCIGRDMVRRHWSEWKDAALALWGVEEPELQSRMKEFREKGSKGP